MVLRDGAYLHFQVDAAVSSPDFCFHTFSYWMSKGTSETTCLYEHLSPNLHLLDTISINQSSNMLSHQSQKTGHHPRPLSGPSLIPSPCFSAWHIVETEQIFIGMNEIYPFLFPLPDSLLAYFHCSGQALTITGWVTATLSIVMLLILHVFSSLVLPLAYNTFKILTCVCVYK